MREEVILVFSTNGAGSNDDLRILALATNFNVVHYPFHYGAKYASFKGLIRKIRELRPALVLMEGTGIAGGAACFWARVALRIQYVVSSGDAIGPWMRTRSVILSWGWAAYERVLCRYAAGFIGWTPYLVGRAMTFGTPRAITAAGWSWDHPDAVSRADARLKVRTKLGIGPNDIVFGIIGSLVWTRRQYCYGLELIEALRTVSRADVKVVICGDGSGLERLKRAAATLPSGRVILTGRVPLAEVWEYLSAMDVGSLPQSVDGIGSFRYTTKISEYLAASLPVVTSQIPMAYDIGQGWLWRLPGDTPWDPRYLAAMAELMQNITSEQIDQRRACVPICLPEFDRDLQQSRAAAFLRDVLERVKRGRTA